MKKCGLVVRVSTEKQASNEEGSLKNQLQRLRAHLEYKNKACGEQWDEVEQYVLKAVSGKDSFRSMEFARLLQDIRTGRVSTVICTALDRVSRSVKDFLSFFEILNEHDVEFVCLKQDYDTTSSQGKFFITVMMALAEFEREQISERNRDASAARAERGLWNGGQVLGYDLDPARKGHLVANEEEKSVVRFAFETYLRCGSILETAKSLNGHGYRTKKYTSRRDRFHPAKEFSYSSVQHLLSNHGYIGKKEIGKRRRSIDQGKLPESQRYRIVDAVWEPIVDEELFSRVQELLRRNRASRHNAVKPVRHNYILNGGLLWCGRCDGEMEGLSGTGRRGIRYYYYVCKNRDCRFRVPAGEIEGVVLARIKELAGDESIVSEILRVTNERVRRQLPQLKQRRAMLLKELYGIRDFADSIMNEWARLTTDEGTAFLKDKLEELGRRRKQLETGIETATEEIRDIEGESVTGEAIMVALGKFADTFGRIQPHRQKELMRLVLHKAVLTGDSMKMALYGRPPDIGPSPCDSPERFSQTPDWYPTCDTFRTLCFAPDAEMRQLFEAAQGLIADT